MCSIHTFIVKFFDIAKDVDNMRDVRCNRAPPVAPYELALEHFDDMLKSFRQAIVFNHMGIFRDAPMSFVQFYPAWKKESDEDKKELELKKKVKGDIGSQEGNDNIVEGTKKVLFVTQDLMEDC